MVEKKSYFMIDIEHDSLETKLYENIKLKMNRTTGLSELNAWRNSLKEMYITLNDSDIPKDAGVAIEYNIPQTSKRVDFLISGYGWNGKGNVVIVTGKPGSGKSKVLREAAESQKWTYVDCRMLISEEFLAIPAADRGLYAPDMFADILASYNADVIILDRLQTLFVPVFHINTDSLMRKLSKKFTIVTAWPGYIDNGNLCYDKFDGTEAIRISPDGFKIWNVEG